MRLEDVTYCPPLVWIPGAEAHGYLLAWLKHELTQEWSAILTWCKITGDEPTYKRMVVTTRAAGLQPMETAAAYRKVPRLLLTTTGTIEPLPRPEG
jgi:hypothetical protein